MGGYYNPYTSGFSAAHMAAAAAAAAAQQSGQVKIIFNFWTVRISCMLLFHLIFSIRK